MPSRKSASDALMTFLQLVASLNFVALQALNSFAPKSSTEESRRSGLCGTIRGTLWDGGIQ
eukprot:3759071-Amphidinium_carterae.1